MPEDTLQIKTISLGDNFSELITRVDKIPLNKIVEISSEYNCRNEFAGILYVLHNNLGIEPKLILNDLQQELDRLQKHQNKPPDIKTYYYQFAIEEGRWIGFFRGCLPNKLRSASKKLHNLYNKFSKVSDSDIKTIATELMMERQFIAANNIIPIIDKWQEEHLESYPYEAGARIIAGFRNTTQTGKIIEEMKNARDELKDQIQIIGEILAESEQNNWILRSLIEAEILLEDFSQKLEEITSKGIADIVLWLISREFTKELGDYSLKTNIGQMITRFQLESELGFENASPLAKLEYNLLSLDSKSPVAYSKLGEEMILEAWKEARLSEDAIDVGRQILSLLIDHSDIPNEFASKVPAHFDYIINHYDQDKIRITRGRDCLGISEEKSDKDLQEIVILDYLFQFFDNYILGKSKADPNDLKIPEGDTTLDLSPTEKEMIAMLDAALKRGIRKQSKKQALEFLESQLESMYNRIILSIKDEVLIGEAFLYGLFNMNNIKIERDKARHLIEKHLVRMNVSLERSSKKRIDSAIQKAILIEVEEKILERDIR